MIFLFDFERTFFLCNGNIVEWEVLCKFVCGGGGGGVSRSSLICVMKSRKQLTYCLYSSSESKSEKDGKGLAVSFVDSNDTGVELNILIYKLVSSGCRI